MTIFHMDMTRVRHAETYPTAAKILSHAESESFDVSITDSTGYRERWKKRFNATLEGSAAKPILRVVDPVLNVERVVSITPVSNSQAIHNRAAEVAQEMHTALIRQMLIKAGFQDAD